MWKVHNMENICSYKLLCYVIIIILQPPLIDECSMVAVKHYDVRISSSDGEMMLERTEPDHAITFMFEYVGSHSIITFKINITVTDINGQRVIHQLLREVFLICQI